MVSVLAWLLAVPVVLLMLVFAVEILAGLVPLARLSLEDQTRPAAVIVPAHNEEAGVGRTVAAIRAALPARCGLLVVADNCGDDTASIARRAGASVVERNDPKKRGKGFALAFARDHLNANPPDVVVVVDADCEIDHASLSALITHGAHGPAQAVNLLRPDTSAGSMVQVSTFAFMIKNLVRQRGLSRLSGRVLLTGTGMALPWSLFQSAHLATDDLVEDLSLGLDLSERGFRPKLVEDATIWSPASSTSGTLKQRQRWEGGFLSASRRRLAPAISALLRRPNLKDLWALLSLSVPPLALLFLLGMAVAVLQLTLLAAGAPAAPLIMMFLSMLGASLALLSAWALLGRAFLKPMTILLLPLYILWKVPLYLRLLLGRPQSWVRADRT